MFPIRKMKDISIKQWFLIIIFLVFFFFLRWNSFTTPFEHDEGEYAYSAWIMRDGIMPYDNSFLQKPPMIVYTYLISQILFGDNLWGPRLIASIFTLFTSFLIYKIALKEFGVQTGLIALFIFTPILVSPINSALSANTEIFMILPLTAMMYIFTQPSKMSKYVTYILLGSLSAIAILYKPICIYLIGFLFIYWMVSILRLRKDNSGIVLILKQLILIFLGGLVTTLIVLTPFILSGAGKSIWEQVVVFNRFYVNHWGFGIIPLIQNLTVMFKSFWMIYILFVLFLFLRPKRWKYFLGLFFFSLLGAYQTTIRHYLIIIMPSLALISAITIEGICRNKVMAKYKVHLTLFIIFTVLFPIRKQFALTPNDLSLWIYGSDNPFYESQLVADQVAKNTSSTDCIFVAGSEPQIYYYSKRRSCSKFVITYPFIVNTPLRTKYQEEAIGELANNPPKAIVYSNKVQSGLTNDESPKLFVEKLNKEIEENYLLLGGWVWGVNGGAWMENPDKDEIIKSSLLLYTLMDNNVKSNY